MKYAQFCIAILTNQKLGIPTKRKTACHVQQR